MGLLAVTHDVSVLADVQGAGVQHPMIGAGRAATEAVGLDEGDRVTGVGQPQRGEQSCDAAADDDRVVRGDQPSLVTTTWLITSASVGVE